MKITLDLEEQVLAIEAKIPDGDRKSYAIAVARERIASIRNVLNIYQEALDRHEEVAMREEPTPSHIERTRGHLNNMAQSLAGLHEGNGDLRVRKRAHKKMYPPKVDAAQDTPKKKRRKKPTQQEIETKIQEQLTQEQEQSREGYIADRNVLIAKLKEAANTEEKHFIKKELDELEDRYAQTYRSFQSGAREREIRREETNSPRPSNSPSKSARTSDLHHSRSGARPKKSNGPSQVDLALRFHDLEDRRKRQQERRLQDLAVQVRSHPFKTYDVKDERLYQTSGIPNRRAKKEI